MTEKRVRLRDLGIRIGALEPGLFNAITDVAGVRVGHATIISGSGPLDVGVGPVRTGVTAVLPNGGDIFMNRVIGGAFVLNGAGEVSGLLQVMEWGLIETPILLTNTLSVGTVSAATTEAMTERYPGIGNVHDVIIPLVGECDDSFVNDISGQHVTSEHVREALDNASSGPVAEGSVGGGTGMVSFDLKGGIGTSSRVLPTREGGFTVGVLVMSNCGRIEDLRVDGLPVGRVLAPRLAELDRRVDLYGSIIAIIATDAPLASRQVNRLCTRVGLGIGRVGSYAAHGSGEIVLGFSTANVIPRVTTAGVTQVKVLSDRWMDPLYKACIEATEEAMLNAMCMAETMVGIDNRVVHALPLAETADIWHRAQGLFQPKNAQRPSS